MKATIFFLTLSALVGQEKASATFTLQPLETFKATFHASLPGVALYESLTCNTTDSGLIVFGGSIAQAAAEAGISRTNMKLVAYTGASAKRRSKKYKAARIMEWVGWTGSSLTATDTIRVGSKVIKAIFPALTQAAHQVADQFETEAPAQVPDLLDPKERIVLEGRACESRLLLGGYIRDFKPRRIPIQ